MQSYIKSILIVPFFFVFISKSYAQQHWQDHVLYPYTTTLFNPAYMPVTTPNISIFYQSKWQGIPDAPTVQALQFSSPVGEKMHFGISAFKDNTFIENTTQVDVNYAYHVLLNKKTTLFLGMKLGVNSYTINPLGLRAFEANGLTLEAKDPVLKGVEKWSAVMGIGAHLKTEKFSLSIAIPSITTPRLVSIENKEVVKARRKLHAFCSASYDFDLPNKDFTLSPSIIMSYAVSSPLQATLFGQISYQKRMSLGLGYTWNNAIAAKVSIKVIPPFTIGYGYCRLTMRGVSFWPSVHNIYMQYYFL